MSVALKEAFSPSVDRSTRVLILGSLPGEASLAARRYYANPANQFWRLIGSVIGEELRPLDYDERLQRLLSHRIGLWDAIRFARRTGSLDTAIRDQQANNLRDFTRRLPDLQAIAFNGGTASKVGRRQLQEEAGPADLLTLPSSSAAYCSVTFDAKALQWQAMRAYLGSD